MIRTTLLLLATLFVLSAPVTALSGVAPAKPVQEQKGIAEMVKRVTQSTGKDCISHLPDGGALIPSPMQAIEAIAKPDGITVTSTNRKRPGSLSIHALAIGRLNGPGEPIRPGSVSVDNMMARIIHPNLIEELTTSIEGVRQDFIVTKVPQGSGELTLELNIPGVTLRKSGENIAISLSGGREFVYHRLQVTDSTGKTLPARFELPGAQRVRIIVADAGAVYPVRIDPTVSDANWRSIAAPDANGGEIYAFAWDGVNLYAVGGFTTMGGIFANHIAKWDGSEWSALGNGMDQVVYTVAWDGVNLYAGGEFTTAGGIAANYIAKWDGNAWSALGSGMNGIVYDLVCDGATNSLYVGGEFTSAGGQEANRVAKWNGSVWSALGSGMDFDVYTVAWDGANLYAGGEFTTADGVDANNIAKWNGSAWSALGSGTDDAVVVLASDGSTLYAGGWFTTAGGTNAKFIAKWNGSTWSALGSGMNWGVYDLAWDGANLYAGGYFTSVGKKTSVSNIAKWDGSAWSALGESGMNGAVMALTWDGAKLYAGGEFTAAGGNPAKIAFFSESRVVTFKSNGGNSVNSQTVPYNTTATLPPAPVNSGYTFAGWYSDASLTSLFNFTTPITTDISLYAKWTINSYSVTYNGNGNTGGTVPIDGSSYAYNNSVTVLGNTGNLTRTGGYNLVGWNTQADGSGIDLAATGTATVTMGAGDITLYAKWSLNSYTVSFNSNGGSAVTSQNVNYNTTATQPTTPTRTGYTFAGWYSNAALTSVFDFATPITGNRTLYAKWNINSYTVSFISNGGSEVTSQSVIYRTRAIQPAAPTKTGYTFVRWYSNAALTTAFNFATLITADTTLYAKWTINSYTVSFNSNGGSAVANRSVQYNATATQPTAPTKTGYTFAGWYSDASLTTAFNFATPITANITLYANWTIKSYTVSFNSNGGSAITSQSVNYNATATQPTAPTRTGYTFAGWHSNTALTLAFDFATPITGNRTLYAKWTINSYTVSFDSNGGSAITNQNVNYNARAIRPTAPTKTGYIFVAWYSDAALTTAFNFATAITADRTLYAKWTIKSYTVSFNSNGGSAVTSQSVQYNATATQPTAPTKTGYTFAGWHSDAGLTMAFDFATPITGAITLYAKWNINSYTVSFNSNGGSAISSQSVIYNTTATQPAAPTKTGYTFGGWYSNVGLTTAFNFATVITGNRTLYARWTINSYTVSFNSNGGSAVANRSVQYNATTTQPTAPTKTGYTFAGWYSDAALTTAFNFATPITANITLYANWTIKSYTVSFNSNGGSAITSQSINFNATATQPTAPTRTGYTFAGWHSNTALTLAFDFATPITGNRTLYAKWTINSYTVSFDNNGGSDITNQNVNYNARAIRPTAPTKTGYTFGAWYSDAALTTAFNFATAITGNRTLYAKWTINSYTVSFNSNGGSAVTSRSVQYNATATQPTAPTKTGNTFAGWYSDAGLTSTFDFATPITGAITLYAKWNINSYTVSFNSNGGSAITSQSVQYNTTATQPAAPTKTSYTFGGWYSNAALTTTFNFATVITSNRILYAKWI